MSSCSSPWSATWTPGGCWTHPSPSRRALRRRRHQNPVQGPSRPRQVRKRRPPPRRPRVEPLDRSVPRTSRCRTSRQPRRSVPNDRPPSPHPRRGCRGGRHRGQRRRHTGSTRATRSAPSPRPRHQPWRSRPHPLTGSRHDHRPRHDPRHSRRGIPDDHRLAQRAQLRPRPGPARRHDEGDLDGYRRGRSEAEVAHVLDAPPLDDHFAQALLSGALREPVGEDMAALLGAVQEHERAARTGSAR